jgi:hypothetical protein
MTRKEAIYCLPLSITLGKKKYYINLNNYRNWHYQVSNKIKGAYHDIVKDQTKEGLSFDKVKLIFVVYYPDKRLRDRSNILSITEKFFCDGLVHCGVIEDDNDNFIESSLYLTGGIDKTDPRVEAFVSKP